MVVFHLVVILQVLLIVRTSGAAVKNSSLHNSRGDFVPCVKGKQYYDFKRKRCRKCPGRCNKAENYLDYNIAVSPEFGALDCYPCYCKPVVKKYNPDTKKCDKCQACNIHSTPNSTVELVIDKWHGGRNCVPCICNEDYFANFRTHFQCTDCIDCKLQNRKIKTPCSKNSDAVCGGCLEGYFQYSLTCEKFRTTTTTLPEMTSVSPEKERSLRSPSTDHGPIINKSYIILIVVLCIVTFVSFVFIYGVYRFIQNTPCHNLRSDSTTPTSIATSAATFSSGASVDKNQINAGSYPSVEGALFAGENTETDAVQSAGEEDDAYEMQMREGLLSDDGKQIFYFIQRGNDNKIILGSQPTSPV